MYPTQGRGQGVSYTPGRFMLRKLGYDLAGWASWLEFRKSLFKIGQTWKYNCMYLASSGGTSHHKRKTNRNNFAG